MFFQGVVLRGGYYWGGGKPTFGHAIVYEAVRWGLVSVCFPKAVCSYGFGVLVFVRRGRGAKQHHWGMRSCARRSGGVESVFFK